MEISQASFLALMLYSALGGVIVGLIYETVRLVRLGMKLLLMPCEVRPIRLFGRQVKLRIVPNKKRNCRISKTVFNATVILTDVFFMIAAAVALILISYAFNAGRMRWMIFVGVAFGTVAYLLTVGRAVMTILGVFLISVGNLMIVIVGAASKPAKIFIKTIKSIPSRIKKRKRRKEQL